MNVIGITGSMGSGKTTAADFFKKRGIKVFDADKIAKDLIRPGQPCFNLIVRYFGSEILIGNEIDRKKMAGIVFRSKKHLNKLCSIVHPEVIRVIKKEIRKAKSKKNIVLDVPLLYESGIDKLCDVVIVVRSTQSQQVERVHKKTGLAKSEILRRIRMQMPIQAKMQRADYIIDNRKTLNQTKIQAEDLCKKVLNK